MGFSSLAVCLVRAGVCEGGLTSACRDADRRGQASDNWAVMGSAGPLEFRLLGPLEVWREGRPLRLRGERQRALLALLLLHANEVVPRERLIEELFGGDASETGANALQVGISRLRRLLGDGRSGNGGGGVIVTHPPGYVLHAEPEQLDVALFERFLAQGRQE